MGGARGTRPHGRGNVAQPSKPMPSVAWQAAPAPVGLSQPGHDPQPPRPAPRPGRRIDRGRAYRDGANADTRWWRGEERLLWRVAVVDTEPGGERHRFRGWRSGV